MREFWNVYDESGSLLEKFVEKGESLQEGEYHLAAEVWVVNSQGSLLIQKRSENCHILPGSWALTTGRIQAGESPAVGGARELFEEMGIAVSREDLHWLRRVVRRDGSHLIWDIFVCRTDVPLSELCLQEDEVSDAKWVSPDEFEKMLADGSLHPYPEIREVLVQALEACGLGPAAGRY